jgi:hypothetical protein
MIVLQSSYARACVLDCGSLLPLSHRFGKWGARPSGVSPNASSFIHVYRFATPKLGEDGAHPWFKKRSKLQNEPNFCCKILSFRKKQRNFFQCYDKRNSSIAQTGAFHSNRLRLFKPF